MLESDELRLEYRELITKARNFLKERQDDTGGLSMEYAQKYVQMEEQIKLTQAQARESFKEEEEMRRMAAETAVPLRVDYETDGIPFVSSKKYATRFFNALRKNFRVEDSAKLIEGSPTTGGYLMPTSFSSAIQTALEEENVVRQIATTITTESEHLIPFVSTKPQASWISEGQTIKLTAETFDRITLGAHKLGAAVTVSNELLADSYYDLQEHLTLEFAKAVAAAEEQAFITGTGEGEPTGILTTIAANSDCYKTVNGLSADVLINLQYSVPRPYRKNACWLTNDTTLAQIRKFKDATQNYIWQPSLLENEPSRLFGQPIYSSPYIPAAESGQISILYGDFSYYVVAERGQRTCRALRELFALQDISAFLMLERIDGKLTDNAAIRGLKIS